MPWRYETVNGRTKSLLVNNPLVEVAAYLFLEDIADKQGAGGMNNYLISLATSLARSMPEEGYENWEEFRESLEKDESIISTFENIKVEGENCIVTTECPFHRGWTEYTQRIGSFTRIHTEVADYYNTIVKPGAIDTQCIIHQTFRDEATNRIRVGNKRLRYAQIACVSSDGARKTAPEEWLPILLEKAGISKTDLNMVLRNNACVWLLYSD